MRHYKKGRKLGTDSSHTAAIKKNLAVALFTNDRIKTTVTRAKEARGYVERIITWAKKGDLHSRRLAIAALGDKDLVREVFEKAEQGMWADRNGGYTRILKLGPRKGDNAPMAILELVEEAVVPKGKKDEGKPVKKSAAKSKKPNKTEELNATPADEIEAVGEEAAQDLADGEVQEVNGAEGIDHIEEMADGQDAMASEVATTDEQDAALEAERAQEDEAITDAGLQKEEAEVEKQEAENIEKIKEEVAKEEKELLDDVNPVSDDADAFEETVEASEKHEDE